MECPLCERREDIHLRKTVRKGSQRSQLGDQRFDERFEQYSLPSQCLGLARECLIFEGFELRRDEAFRVFQRLSANIVRGRVFSLALAELDVVTMNTVVSNLKCG